LERDAAAPTASEDARLVQAALLGDADAFGLLVRRHLAAAHRVAMRVLENSHDAEDACQDAFVQALVHLESCEHPESFGGWLLTIVRNRSFNLLKARKVRTTEPLEWAEASARSNDDPSRSAYHGEVRGRIEEALGRLTTLQRRVVEMFDGEGWSHREIAEQLGISEGSSRVHLHAARAKLRLQLGDLNPFGGRDERKR
jgi:RNA polymerase sigma-70 factor (ECF subfamily)